jgi:hypothetical protein
MQGKIKMIMRNVGIKLTNAAEMCSKDLSYQLLDGDSRQSSATMVTVGFMSVHAAGTAE